MFHQRKREYALVGFQSDSLIYAASKEFQKRQFARADADSVHVQNLDEGDKDQDECKQSRDDGNSNNHPRTRSVRLAGSEK